MFLPAEAVAALIGAGVGWLLGGVTSVGLRDIEKRSTRKIAARLIYAELTVNASKVETLLGTGAWATGPLDHSAWEAHRADLLYRGSEQRLVRLARAYSNIDDVEYLANVGAFSGPDDKTLRRCLDTIERGRIEAGEIGGIRGAPSA
jgi:hypothetical protein